MMYCIKTVVLVLGVLALPACKMSDEERCPKGYDYVKKFMICEKSDDTETTDQDGEDDIDGGDSEPDPDGGASDDSETVGSKVGDPCEVQDECLAPADYCVVRQGVDIGYCSVVGCDFGECPKNFYCCDCTEVEGYGSSACLTTGDAALAPIIGCICE